MSQALNSTPLMRDPRYDDNNLIWVDMEMCGLNPDCDRVLEMAVVVTGPQLDADRRRARARRVPGRTCAYVDGCVEYVDTWPLGPDRKVRVSKVHESEAEDEVIAFLERYVAAGKSPMCGNSICQDRRFMARWMPRLENFFHYRNLDVSTLKELARRWKPEIVRLFEKKSRHEALADIYDSIAELKHYRQHLIVS